MAILTVGLCYTKDTLCQTDKTHAHSLPLFYMCVCIYYLERTHTLTNKPAQENTYLQTYTKAQTKRLNYTYRLRVIIEI